MIPIYKDYESFDECDFLPSCGLESTTIEIQWLVSYFLGRHFLWISPSYMSIYPNPLCICLIFTVPSGNATAICFISSCFSWCLLSACAVCKHHGFCVWMCRKECTGLSLWSECVSMSCSAYIMGSVCWNIFEWMRQLFLTCDHDQFPWTRRYCGALWKL